MGAHTSRLHIGRYRAECLVSSAHPNPNGLKERLDGAVRKRLPEVLGEALGAQLVGTDESVWLVRRLDVSLVVNADWDRTQLAKQSAEHLVRSLVQSLQEDEADVLHFPDRAAYLARFVTDLAAGHAWSRWYYEPFRGLRLLSVSAALRTVLCERPATGRAALLHLPEHARHRVIDALTASDARHLLDALPTGDAHEDPTQGFDALWSAWTDGGNAPSASSREPHTALLLCLRACSPDAPHRMPFGSTLAAIAQALARLARLVVDSSSAERLLAALVTRDPAPLYAVAGTQNAEVLRPLRDVPPERVRAAAHRLAGRSGRASTSAPSSSRHKSTPFGGAFLLLPLLDALPAEEATQGWPDAAGTPPADALRFVLLVKCLGQRRALRVFTDPLLRDVLRIAPAFSAGDVGRWQARLTREQLDALLAALAVRRCDPDEVKASAVLVRVALPGAPAGVLLDGTRGAWLYAAGYAPRRPDRLIERVRAWLGSAGLEGWVADQRIAEPLPEGLSLGGNVVVTDVVSQNLRHLALPNAFCPSRPADLALSVAAHGVMRDVAQRLPGFATSSLPYLVTNVLDVAASVDEGPERRVVTLGRPPLQYVLGLSGLARSTYRLSWLDARPFVLFQE